jgi:hypothetical protein
VKTSPLPLISMHSPMKTLALFALLAIGAAAAADVHPFTAPKVTGTIAFLETFTSGLGQWIAAKDDKYNGAWRADLLVFWNVFANVFSPPLIALYARAIAA